jgi:hypothetical protein
MTAIDIPFSREMAIAAIDCRKVATTRSARKGEIGDTFTLPIQGAGSYHTVAVFRIIEIMAVDLETVKNLYFRLEGFNSPEEFEKAWRALHRGHFTTDKLYYIHFFGRIA